MKKAAPTTIAAIFTVLQAFSGQLRTTLENDFPWHDDSDYTHGTRIEYVQDNGLRYGAQQQMYTPKDLRNSEQVPGRHPYAGTLIGFIGGRMPFQHGPLATYNDLELQLGVLGPASLAEQTQRYVHKLVGAKNPQGWDHQLHDEAIVQSVYWYGADWLLAGREGGWQLRWVSEAGGMLGTLQMAPGANTSLKFGYGFGPAEIDTEMRVRSARGRRSPSWRAYGLIGCEGRWWLRNELLDGNAHYVENHDTLTVEKEPLTGCLKAGVGAGTGRFDIMVLWMWWTREYETQESTPNYASMAVSWRF